LLYTLLGIWSGFVGLSFSLLIRINFLEPYYKVVSLDCYKFLVTKHGIIMIFFFLMPVLIGGFGNYLLPLLGGLSDLNLPRLKALSGVDFLMFSLHLAGVSSIFSSINFICTLYSVLSSSIMSRTSIVYVLILPGFGIISHVCLRLGGNFDIFGFYGLLFAMFSIVCLGSILSFIVLFTFGGVTGIVLSACLSLKKCLLQCNCIVSKIGFNLCFFPMHYFGLCGLPRRVCVYDNKVIGFYGLSRFVTNLILRPVAYHNEFLVMLFSILCYQVDVYKFCW
uniref:Cytochrome c oxidase subunit 1 n=1 Tax=Mesocestoides corti TaxID=53468 RepID=A0A0R3UCX4_MESCO